ncbi:MAG: hypothetical protein WBV69_12340 [Candidatus Sulfotelmatobacter sp.]
MPHEQGTKFTTGSTFEVARQRSDGKSDLFFGDKGQTGSDKGHAVFDDKGRPEYILHPDNGPLGSAGGWNNNSNE